MPKTITLRLKDDIYSRFNQCAEQDNRSIANLIETLAIQKLNDDLFVDDFEMYEIIHNDKLMQKLKRGHQDGKQRRGRLVV